MELHRLAYVRELGITEELTFQQDQSRDIAEGNVICPAFNVGIPCDLADLDVASTCSDLHVAFDLIGLNVTACSANFYVSITLRNVDVATAGIDLHRSLARRPNFKIRNKARPHHESN